MNHIFKFFLLFALFFAGCSREKADIVLVNAEVYTMEESQQWATSIAIKNDIIIAVGADDGAMDKYIGPETELYDLEGRFVLPGFIDGHTHFSRAGEMINDANLMTVSDDAGLRKEMERLTGILDEGEWINGGLWGAYEEWSLGATEAAKKKSGRWEPDRKVIDDITSSHPALLSSFDRKLYLANSAALEAAGLEDARHKGMKRDRSGRLTGIIYEDSPALEILNELKKKFPKSEERILNEYRAGFKQLRESGIVEIHDVTREEHMENYVKLEQSGELTARVWMRADLARAQEFKDKKVKPGQHPITMQPDNFLRWGSYKGYIDGIMGGHSALFFEPYDDQPENYGRYRNHTSDDGGKTGNMDKIYGYLKIAAESGFTANVHAIGTKGSSLMLDTFEKLMNELGTDLTGFRVIHAQVIRPEDFPRFKQLNVFAEVNPYHLSDDMRWMEERIGHERSKGAYAFKSLLENSASLVFGSDWPGTQAAYYHVHPKYLIHAAVNRTTLNHEPEGGWFPEQKISIEDVLKAYTVNSAAAAFNLDTRGTIKVGKLADIAVCDLNLIKIAPDKILDMNVDMTIVDGIIVYNNNVLLGEKH